MLHQIPYIATNGIRVSPPCTQRTRETAANTMALYYELVPDEKLHSPGVSTSADHDDFPRFVRPHGDESTTARATTTTIGVEGGREREVRILL